MANGALIATYTFYQKSKTGIKFRRHSTITHVLSHLKLRSCRPPPSPKAGFLLKDKQLTVNGTSESFY